MLSRFVIVMILLASVAFGERGRLPLCTRVLADAAKGITASEQFWAQNEDAVIQTPTGPKSFAFGFDAELWHVSDVIKLIAKDPQAKALAERQLENMGITYGHKKMANFLGYKTVAEFREDALIPGAINKPLISVFDLKPTHYEFFSHGHKEKSEYAEALTDAVTLSLNNRGLPVEAKYEEYSGSRQQGPLGDGAAIELIQKGSMTNKAKFRQLMLDFLDAEVDFPETHFHVSVPNDAANAKEMLLAARALEAKITLEEVIESLDYEGTLYPYDWSAIAKKWDPTTVDNLEEDFVQRGIVRVSLKRWPTPYPAHDVEIRQWFDTRHGLENMHFFMELIKKKERLRDTTAFTADHVGNVAPANLNATLRYTALLLKDRLPPGKAFIIGDLERFAKQIETADKITPTKRNEIARYFKEKNLLQYVTLETFLEPATATPAAVPRAPAPSQLPPIQANPLLPLGAVPQFTMVTPGRLPSPADLTPANNTGYPGTNYAPFPNTGRDQFIPPSHLGWPPVGYAYRMVMNNVIVRNGSPMLEWVGTSGSSGNAGRR